MESECSLESGAHLLPSAGLRLLLSQKMSMQQKTLRGPNLDNNMPTLDRVIFSKKLSCRMLFSPDQEADSADRQACQEEGGAPAVGVRHVGRERLRSGLSSHGHHLTSAGTHTAPHCKTDKLRELTEDL